MRWNPGRTGFVVLVMLLLLGPVVAAPVSMADQAGAARPPVNQLDRLLATGRSADGKWMSLGSAVYFQPGDPGFIEKHAVIVLSKAKNAMQVTCRVFQIDRTGNNNVIQAKAYCARDAKGKGKNVPVTVVGALSILEAENTTHVVSMNQCESSRKVKQADTQLSCSFTVSP